MDGAAGCVWYDSEKEFYWELEARGLDSIASLWRLFFNRLISIS